MVPVAPCVTAEAATAGRERSHKRDYSRAGPPVQSAGMHEQERVSAARLRAQQLLDEVGTRIAQEPDLDDFLGWWGGTLEYWIHILTAAVARRSAWAARSEIPYVTGAPAASAKTPLKWADGAFIWRDGAAVLLEVKTIPHRGALGEAVTSIPTDLAALVAADWPATLAHQRLTDRYTDGDWWETRGQIRSLVGVQIAVVHGPRPLPDPDDAVSDGISRGLTRALYRHRKDAESPRWADPVRTALQEPAVRRAIDAPTMQAVLYGWIAAIPLAASADGS